MEEQKRPDIDPEPEKMERDPIRFGKEYNLGQMIVEIGRMGKELHPSRHYLMREIEKMPKPKSSVDRSKVKAARKQRKMK